MEIIDASDSFSASAVEDDASPPLLPLVEVKKRLSWRIVDINLLLSTQFSCSTVI